MLVNIEVKDLITGFDGSKPHQVFYGVIRQTDYNKSTVQYIFRQNAWFNKLVENTAKKVARNTFHLGESQIKSMLTHIEGDLTMASLENVAYENDFDITKNYENDLNRAMCSYIGNLIKYAVTGEIRKYVDSHNGVVSIEQLAEKVGKGKADAMLLCEEWETFDPLDMDVDTAFDDVEKSNSKVVNGKQPLDDLEEVDDDDFDLPDGIDNMEQILGDFSSYLTGGEESSSKTIDMDLSEGYGYETMYNVLKKSCVSMINGELVDISPYIVFAGAYHYYITSTKELLESSKDVEIVVRYIKMHLNYANENNSDEFCTDNTMDEDETSGDTKEEVSDRLIMDNLKKNMFEYAQAMCNIYGYDLKYMSEAAKNTYVNLLKKLGCNNFCKFCLICAGREYFGLENMMD